MSKLGYCVVPKLGYCVAFKRKSLFTYALMLVFLSGCAAFKRPPVVDTCDYRPIPEGYLQPCELPAAPLANGLLSKGFVQAYQCAVLGNDDKARIRKLVTKE